MDVKNCIADFQLIGTKTTTIALKNTFLQLPPLEQLKLQYDVEYEITSLQKDDSVWIGILNLSVKASARENKSRKLSISLSIEGGFVAPLEVPEDEMKELLSLNGCATLYAIARAQIVTITSQSLSGGQLILPMTNFFKLKEAKGDHTH